MSKTAAKLESGGVVRPGEMLTYAAARRALSVGDWAWRDIKPLVPSVKVGRQRYVFSDDLIAAFRKLLEEQQGGGQS